MANQQLPVEEQFAALGLEDLNLQRMCAPLQQNFNAVPQIELDISPPLDGEDDLDQRYADFMEQIIRRAIQIASAKYYQIPITPYPNPANNRSKPSDGHSYYRILMTYRSKNSMRVEFLMRDVDLYLLGFRRLMEDGITWSPWYRFKDNHGQLGWPSFPMGTVKIFRFDGGHENKASIGGRITLEHIFFTLGRCNGETDAVKAASQQAMVYFSKALRFHYVFQVLVQRIQGEEGPTSLDTEEVPTWKRIGHWAQFSALALKTGLNGGVIRTMKEMGMYQRLYKINGFMEMVNGLKMLKRINVSHLVPHHSYFNVAYGMRVAEPGFIPLNQEYPDA